MRVPLFSLLFVAFTATAQVPTLTLEQLPRPTMPPGECGPVVPAQVERWRQEAKALEYGDGVKRDEVAAARLYCRAARYGDAEAQYSLGWMLTNARGIQRNDAEAAHMFAAAAEQGMAQAQNILDRMGGTPLGDPPPCLRPPETDPEPVVAPKPVPRGAKPPAAVSLWASLPLPQNAPPAIVNYVKLLAPDLFDREPIHEMDGLNLDRLDIECTDYLPRPDLLTAAFDDPPVQEVLTSHLLKSNCRVTGQPDWGSVQIAYSGPQIDQGGLLRYLVSFRNHNEFHEQCVERIFMDVWTRCKPIKLTVYARYTRRGGLDINPLRTSHPQGLPRNARTARQ